ncbi:MAG: VWA domain-containing protein [bacterium]|nr:VWA domain-containing protein [bacterium]
MKPLLKLLGILLFLPFALPGLGALEPGDLDDLITTPTYGYEVYYTNDPNNTSDFMPDNEAQNAADSLDAFVDRITDLGFRVPHFSADPPEVHIYDSNNIGTAPESVITLDSPNMRGRDEPSMRLVMDHEHFHHTQYAYINFADWATWGRWVVEGTARLMQDKLWNDLDANAGVITFWEEVDDYMASTHTRLTDLSYATCLFWQYLCEQIGTVNTEPQQGVDVIRRFWEETDGRSPDSMGALKRMLSAKSPGRNLDQLFQDFGIANYTKDLDLSEIANAARYQYSDDDDTAYPSVDTHLRRNFLPTIGPTAATVNDYANRYYIGLPVEGVAGKFIGFRSEGQRAGYAVMAVRDGKVVSLHRGVGTEFARAFFQPRENPIDELVAVVTGLESAASFTYTFTAGDVKLSIIEPTLTRMAFVGEPDNPETFLVRVQVAGSAELGGSTIWGLRAEDFTVKVGNEVAPVLSGDYVQGEFWMVVQAPVQPAGGALFDLSVQLANQTATQRQSVLYAKILKKEALVIDASGSMLSPSDYRKIDAAKSAALLYADSTSNDNQVAVVSFGGDNVEPNEDAKTLFALQEAGPNRNAIRSAINGISIPNAGVLTSIGDGLNKGQDELDKLPSPEFQPFIVLLSDGMENEGRFWENAPEVRSRILSSGTHVVAIALGPTADQALMQDIASDTGGYYYYVDLNPTAAAKVSPNQPVLAQTNAMVNYSNLDYSIRLADVYKMSQEFVGNQSRLWEEAGSMTAGEKRDLKIDLQEGGVTKAVLAFYWSNDKAGTAVDLFRPDGSLVQSGDAGVQIFRSSRHIVYQMEKLERGLWSASFGTQADIDFIGMLSGIPESGLTMDVRFTANHWSPELREFDPQRRIRFLRGLPIPIQATLQDKKGPILDAQVTANILAPDGQVDVIPLFDDGAHGDGSPDDGIYGNIYRRTTMASQAGDPDVAKVPTGQNGSYLVRVEAAGVDHTGELFSRYQKAGFQVFEFFNLLEKIVDLDRDGMPTRWELLYGLDPNKDDAQLDLDGDGLTNGDEYRWGTLPNDPDTDRGGENDLSEVKNQRNNADHRDDTIDRLINCGVIDFLTDLPIHEPKPNVNQVYFSWPDSYKAIHIFRGTKPDALSRVATVEPGDVKNGIWEDKAVVNNTTYFYQIIGEGENNSLSAPSRIFQGTPKADPLPPKGWVKVNNGVGRTDSLFVKVELDQHDDIKEMRVGPRASFAGNAWQSSANLIPNYQIEPRPGLPFTVVWAQFRDAALNESDSYSDKIILDFDGDPDADGLRNADDPDNDNDGLSDDFELYHSRTNHFVADSDHNGVPDNLEDHDKDGLTNAQELQAQTNPWRADTDGDGYSDGEEVQSNTSPTDPTQHPVGPIEPPSMSLQSDLFWINEAKFQQKTIFLPETLSTYDPQMPSIIPQYRFGYSSTSGEGGKPVIALPSGNLLTMANETQNYQPLLLFITPTGDLRPFAKLDYPIVLVGQKSMQVSMGNIVGFAMSPGKEQLNVITTLFLHSEDGASSAEVSAWTIIEGPFNTVDISDMILY